jgi:uncharacterized protein YceH (UPF0502 family)
VTITPEGGRVLGCLVEKQLTTPQQYPLTRNALSLACSQATNREPVMTLDDEAVQRALGELKELHLVRFVLPSHGRSVTRYRHVLDEVYGLDVPRVALLAILLLRGPQTPGELRARAGRMAEFDSVSTVQGELEVLAGQPEPLVRLLPRRPGQKEDRWQQLLAAESGWAGGTGGPESTIAVESDTVLQRSLPVDTARHDMPTEAAGIEDNGHSLEHRVEMLAAEVQVLRDRIVELEASLSALRHSLGE